MTLATSLRTAARSLISTFGNSATVYTYSTATKTTSEEGDVAVSSWGSGTSITIVDGDNAREVLEQASQGRETLGEDEKITTDTATIVTNDRLTLNSVEYRVESVSPIRTQDTLIIQVISVSRVTGTSNW